MNAKWTNHEHPSQANEIKQLITTEVLEVFKPLGLGSHRIRLVIVTIQIITKTRGSRGIPKIWGMDTKTRGIPKIWGMDTKVLGN